MIEGLKGEDILKAVDILIEKRIKESKTIDWYEGIVRQTNKNGTYDVESTGTVLTVYGTNNNTYNIGDIVIVIILGTQRYILTQKNKIVI